MGMEEKNEGRTPKRVNPSTDDTLLNLMYYYINGAAIVLEVISFFDDALLKTDLSKEQKAALKKELHFTGKAIHYLTDARNLFRKLDSTIGLLTQELENFVDFKTYDIRQIANNELICHDIAYMFKTNCDPEAEKAFKEFDLSNGGEFDHSHSLLYELFSKRSEGFTSKYQ